MTVNFVNPQTGEITRKVTPAPNPLSSHNNLKAGMAFGDEVYLPTKALYADVLDGCGKMRTEDESLQLLGRV